MIRIEFILIRPEHILFSLIFFLTSGLSCRFSNKSYRKRNVNPETSNAVCLTSTVMLLFSPLFFLFSLARSRFRPLTCLSGSESVLISACHGMKRGDVCLSSHGVIPVSCD